MLRFDEPLVFLQEEVGQLVLDLAGVPDPAAARFHRGGPANLGHFVHFVLVPVLPRNFKRGDPAVLILLDQNIDIYFAAHGKHHPL